MGSGRNAHIGRPPAQDCGTGNTASKNHPGARYRRDGKFNSLPPTTFLKREKQKQNTVRDPAQGIFVFHSALQLTAQSAHIPQ